MRRFFLENETGARYPLNNESGVFLSNPTGLGVTLNPAFSDLRSGFFRNTSADAEPQSVVVCDLVFTRDAYAGYRAFVNWCSTAKKLYLVYLPYGGTEYFRAVTVNYLTKTELTATRWLTVPISFACTTPWYRAAPTRMSMAGETGGAMRYTFIYDASLVYSASSTGGMAADISAGGHIPAAFVLSCRGELVNPRIALKGLSSGVTYGVCSLSETISANERLEVSTLYGDSHIIKTNAAGSVTDLLDSADLAYEPFPRVPMTEDCSLTLSADEAITGEADIRVYYYYRSV